MGSIHDAKRVPLSAEMRLRRFVWNGILVVLCSDIAGLFFVGRMTLHVQNYILLMVLACAVGFQLLYSLSSWLRTRRQQVSGANAVFGVAVFFEAITQIQLALIASYILQHICGSFLFPYQDKYLLYADKALGFDWIRSMGWIDLHPQIAKALFHLYMSNLTQLLLLPAILSFTEQFAKLYAVVAAFLVSVVSCILIAALLPATSIITYLHLDPGTFSHIKCESGYAHMLLLEKLRHHQFGVIEIPVHIFYGLVTFPSYHACMAVLLVWALWTLPWLRWPVLVVDFLMIIATPFIGGHYLVDVIAGVMLALATIYLIECLTQKFCHDESENAGSTQGR